MTTTTVDTVRDNRSNATTDDAMALKRIWLRLGKKLKAVKTAERAMREGWGDSTVNMDEARTEFYDAQHEFHAAQQECWGVLRNMPNGTVASGGATPQTVALEFYSANLNRTLANRTTVAEAKKRNKTAFAPAA